MEEGDTRMKGVRSLWEAGTKILKCFSKTKMGGEAISKVKREVFLCVLKIKSRKKKGLGKEV